MCIEDGGLQFVVFSYPQYERIINAICKSGTKPWKSVIFAFYDEMRQKFFPLLLLVSFILPAWRPNPAEQSAPRLLEVILYDDALASGWENWSWAQVDLAASDPVHSGDSSIQVVFDAWQGLYLHKAGVDTLGVTHLRFFAHGGSSGGQQMNLFLYLEVGGSPQNGLAQALPALPANDWLEVQLALSELNPTNATVTGITWQDATGGSQPTFYIDDIALVGEEDPDAPLLTDLSLHPRSLPADGATSLSVSVQVADPQGGGDIDHVTLDAGSLGLGTLSLEDDGRSNDGAAGDGRYGVALEIPPGTPLGERRLLLQAVDMAGHSGLLPTSVVSVLDSPGGTIPAPLPGRLGWGSNAWSETPGDDWQVNSGVAWDYVYQYITYGWESWSGSFVQRFSQQAWDKGYIPMVTVYLMLGVPPDCGEGGACYAEKLQNASTVQAYLESLRGAAQEAQGDQPVIFNIEPDFYGFMQQLSNSTSRPPGVLPDDPASYPVALNKTGYANNLAGFGRYIVDMLHATAPNALVAPMASSWATNADPQSVTYGEARQMAQRTAAFINEMGGAQADLLVVEWSDRDAGSGLRPWWDDSDQETPRPTRAILWANALSNAAGKRLFLWQMPVGNMGLDNTCDHYQDNRAAYAFSHPRDLADAGVIGVLFGGGAACMTQVWTDGGYVAAQGAIAYADPATPAGLSLDSVNGSSASLSWDENSEPDLWHYRLHYQLPGGSAHTLNAGRHNAAQILLSQPGEWQVTISAVDAMGNESAQSTPITLTTTSSLPGVYLPLVLKD